MRGAYYKKPAIPRRVLQSIWQEIPTINENRYLNERKVLKQNIH